MALVEPLVGHLLSQYAETVNEGFEKIRKNADKDVEFAVTFLSHPQGMQAMKKCLIKNEFTANVIETLCYLMECTERPLAPTSTVTRGQQRGARLSAIREFCSGDAFAVLRKALSALSDATLVNAMATLKFLSLAATHAPKLLLARFNNKLPLHLACFRSQLPYSQRRIRLSRLGFLLKLADARQSKSAADVLCTHGFLTSMFEDAAEVLQEGTVQGLEAGKAVLRVFQENFITSQAVPPAQKRSVLLGQRNIFRLLVKALDVPAVAEDVAEVMYHMVTELVESPADYASTRVEAADGKGMPNFAIFFLLRQLRPNASALASRIALFILNTVPELIRPYFARVSGHLADEGNLAQRVAPSTACIATMNLLTRIFTAPIPYHLLSRRATLEPVSAKSTTFYALSPRDVADEVCPQWVAEYVHKAINGSTNLMTLALAVQLAQAALARAKVVLALVADIQRDQAARAQSAAGKDMTSLARGAHRANGDASTAAPGQLDDEDVALFTAEDAQEEAEDFDARVQAQLLSALPRREEFWHRMTQQLQPALVDLYKKSRGSNNSSVTADDTEAAKLQSKVEFVYQRLLLLMQNYTDVFNLRVSWLSAAPSFLPVFAHSDRGVPVIAKALTTGNDALCALAPQSISALCGLLVAALARGVPMPKLHHITMSNPKGGITEWPLLLSLLLWAARHRATADSVPGTHEALAWVARVVQWVLHSVTVRQGCEFDEALLWVLCMEEEAIPCFLHMLNSLLQRSLSKAADRVTLELTGGADGSAGARKGLLLAASQSFVEKTEEKMSAAAAGSAEGKQATNAGKKGQGKATGAAPELWVQHLHACLPVYKQIMHEVAAAWPKHVETVNARVVHPLQETRAKWTGTSGRASIFNPAACLSRGAGDASSPPQHRALHKRLTARPAPHRLLKAFCTSLSDPVATLNELASAAEEVSVEESAMLQVLATSGLMHTAAALQQKSKPNKDMLTALTTEREAPASLWCRMRSLCWSVAGRLLSELNDATAAGSQVAFTTLRSFARAVLKAIADDASGLSTVLTSAKETDTFPFFVLILALLRVELTVAALPPRPADEADTSTTTSSVLLEISVIQTLEQIVLSTYNGSLSTPDRVRYAALLSLHYLHELPGVKVRKNSEEISGEEDNAESGSDGDASNSDDDSDDSEGDKESDSGAGASDGNEEKNLSETANGHVGGSSAKSAKRVRYSRARVPRGLQTNRFLIGQHEPTAFVTPEADMLSYIIGSLTEKELQSIALHTPARLHNTLRCVATPSHRADGHGIDLLFSVFPEMSRKEDATVMDMSEATSSTLLDPRFFLPLVHTVAALPDSKYRRFAVRCTPLLVRGLSYTEIALRRFAMCALFVVAHVPQQRYTTPEGVSSHAHQSSRRIIASFARLKVVQLAEKHQRQARRGGGAVGVMRGRPAGGFLPRLSGPLSAFLVLALDAIATFDDRLHNHFVAFLNEPKTAFAATVPFATWLSHFPLDAVSAPLMIKQQEEVQRTSSMVSSSIAQSSAEEAMAELRKNTPPHLIFMLDLVQSACSTTGDAVAIVRSESVERLMLMSDLVTSSQELRLRFITCLTAVCETSYQVASLLALRRDSRDGGGGLLPWLLTFLAELHREYGSDVALYSEALYTGTLKLLRLLCRVASKGPVVTSLASMSGAGRTASSAALVFRGQVAAQLRLLQEHLFTVGVTAKEPLDMMEQCVHAWEAAQGEGRASDIAEVARKSGESEEKQHPLSGDKRSRASPAADGDAKMPTSPSKKRARKAQTTK